MSLLRIALLMTALLVLGAVALYQYRSLPSVATVAALGEEIRLANVGATLLSSQRLAGLGEGPGRVSPDGVFVVAQLRVANHAARENHDFDEQAVLLVDAQGAEHAVDAEAQKYVRTSRPDGCSSALPPGGVCTTELVFDVPVQSEGLHLRLRSGSGMLAKVVDTIRFGKQRIRVP